MNYYINKLNRGEYLDTVDLWEAFDEIAEALGVEGFLNALAKAIGTDELKENMQYIIRCYDLAEPEEEDKEEC